MGNKITEVKTMEEKAYKIMNRAGGIGITLGVISILVGVTTGVLMIITGAKLLSGKSGLTF